MKKKQEGRKMIGVWVSDTSDLPERFKAAAEHFGLMYSEMIDKWLTAAGFPTAVEPKTKPQLQLPLFHVDEHEIEIEKKDGEIAELKSELRELQGQFADFLKDHGKPEPIHEPEQKTKPDPLEAAEIYKEASREATLAYIKNLSEIEKWSDAKIAEHLNEKGYSTFSGRGKWQAGTISKLRKK